MNSYFYNISATNPNDLATALAARLVPNYFDVVNYDSSTSKIVFALNNNIIAELAITADGASGYSLTGYVGGETATKARDLQSTDTFYSGHETDNAFLFTVVNSSGVKYVTIFTKNQNDDVVVITADGDDYFAFSPADDDTPVTITTVSANDKYVTELVPFTTNTATNGYSYTPHAFWLPITSSYPTTGSIAYSFVRMVDQQNTEYFYNGYIAIN